MWCQIVSSIISGLPRPTQTVCRTSCLGPQVLRFTKKNSESLKTERLNLVTTAGQEDVQPKRFVVLRVVLIILLKK